MVMSLMMLMMLRHVIIVLKIMPMLRIITMMIFELSWLTICNILLTV